MATVSKRSGLSIAAPCLLFFAGGIDIGLLLIDVLAVDIADFTDVVGDANADAATVAAAGCPICDTVLHRLPNGGIFDSALSDRIGVACG